MNAKKRYQENAGGRKERDGFICSSATHKWFDCVAVKIGRKNVYVRDTKDITDTTLSFTHNEWRAFLKGIGNGEFDV